MVKCHLYVNHDNEHTLISKGIVSFFETPKIGETIMMDEIFYTVKFVRHSIFKQEEHHIEIILEEL